MPSPWPFARPDLRRQLGDLLRRCCRELLGAVGGAPLNRRSNVRDRDPTRRADSIPQLLHLFDSPNRLALDPFCTLHVWAWKDNPNGTFTNWNPNVSCDGFNPKSEPPAVR
jgi:hypothetical protein